VIVVDPEPAAFNAASATTAAITNISPIATTERTHHRAYLLLKTLLDLILGGGISDSSAR
jgi:hypothetical protein